MLKRIILLTIFSFLACTAYAHDSVGSNEIDSVLNSADVSIVKYNQLNQYFFMDKSQKTQVFVADKDNIMDFSIIVIRAMTEGPLVVMCKRMDNQPAEIMQVGPGESYHCRTEKWVAMYYHQKIGFTTGMYNIVTLKNKINGMETAKNIL